MLVLTHGNLAQTPPGTDYGGWRFLGQWFGCWAHGCVPGHGAAVVVQVWGVVSGWVVPR